MPTRHRAARRLRHLAVAIAIVLGGAASASAITVLGGGGGDRLFGKPGADRILGRNGDDRLWGRAGADRLFGSRGKDQLRGAAGKDLLNGGPGDDRVWGGKGPDTLLGGRGKDLLNGGPGPDVVHGGFGVDRLFGGKGDDRILARDRRRDVINCGPGRDVAVVDRFDRVVPGCETIQRPGDPPAPGGPGVPPPPPGGAPPPPGPAGPGIGLEPIAPGPADALLVLGRPGDARPYVVRQSGTIAAIQGDGTLAPPLLDITGLTDADGERGLLGLAFHPDHAANGLFYVNYTTAADGTSIVAEYMVPSGQAAADPGTARVLMRVPQPFGNHNGGMLAFGADGMLYVSLGDGGSGGDPEDNGQDLSTLLGAILRIDVNSRDAGLEYAVPADNPFVGTPGARGELWSIGLRNPWRFSVDPANGSFWIGDVGQGDVEEINHLTHAEARGANFGWNRFEGSAVFDNRPLITGVHKPPVAEYDHSGGRCSVTGGYVYRGARVTDLAGRYVYGDFCSGQIWTLAADGPAGAPVEITAQTGVQNGLRSFGADLNGEIYVISGAGISRLAPASPG